MRTVNRGKKRFKALAIGALVLSSLLYTAPSAHAADWSMAAAGCTPRGGGVVTNPGAGTIEFPGNATGTISATCPVSGFGGGVLPASSLKVGFYDSDDRRDGCIISAILLRGNLTLERGGELARFDSSGGIWSDVEGTGRKEGTVRFNEVINLDENYYFVDLVLTRNTAACNVLAVEVHLE
jgi:hypothetical protein